MSGGAAQPSGQPTSHAAGADSSSPPIPRREPVARGEVPPPPMVAANRYPAQMAALLREVRGQVQHIHGLLLATQDGLVVGTDTRGVQDDSVAAMAAAAAGLAAQFTAQAAVGQPRSSMFEGGNGYVGVFPAEAGLLLVVFGQPDISMGLFNVAAKQALGQVRQGLSRQQVLNIRQTRRTYFEHSPPVAESNG